MPGLPLHLWLLWPLIFWRIRRLKAWFRAKGGPGSQMLWGVMKDGRVVVIRLSDDFYPQPRSFRAPVSARLEAALSGDAPALPVSTRPRPRGRPLAAHLPGIRPDGGRLSRLPLPDT